MTLAYLFPAGCLQEFCQQTADIYLRAASHSRLAALRLLLIEQAQQRSDLTYCLKKTENSGKPYRAYRPADLYLHAARTKNGLIEIVDNTDLLRWIETESCWIHRFRHSLSNVAISSSDYYCLASCLARLQMMNDRFSWMSIELLRH